MQALLARYTGPKLLRRPSKDRHSTFPALCPIFKGGSSGEVNVRSSGVKVRSSGVKVRSSGEVNGPSGCGE